MWSLVIVFSGLSLELLYEKEDRATAAWNDVEHAVGDVYLRDDFGGEVLLRAVTAKTAAMALRDMRKGFEARIKLATMQADAQQKAARQMQGGIAIPNGLPGGFGLPGMVGKAHS